MSDDEPMSSALHGGEFEIGPSIDPLALVHNSSRARRARQHLMSKPAAARPAVTPIPTAEPK